MSEKSISCIREELKATETDLLPFFIEEYKDDERAGVISLVKRASKLIKQYEAEKNRLYAMRQFERKYENCSLICGIDEAGRGPLAGPVVAGAVILPKDCEILYLDDSKKLSEKKREMLYDEISKKAIAWAVGEASESLIDEINILNATYEAAKSAVMSLGIIPDILLNDALKIPGIDIAQEPIIKGDAKSVSIAAASVMAKVSRDRKMKEYDDIYPGYGFASHKGYGTKEHIAAIKALGPCKIHRKSFISAFV